MMFLIAQIKLFGKLNATQKKPAALYKALILNKSRKTARNWPFLTKNAFLTPFRQFFLIFSRTVLSRGLRFLRCVQCPKTHNLSYQKPHLEKNLNFSLSKKLPDLETKVNKIKK